MRSSGVITMWEEETLDWGKSFDENLDDKWMPWRKSLLRINETFLWIYLDFSLSPKSIQGEEN